jgi:predicted deacylase
VPAIYVEHGGGSTFNPVALNDMVDGCINVARHLKMLDGDVRQWTPKLFAEDPRSQSGHLQVQNAATIDGLFKADVRLGDVVARDGVLGNLQSPITGEIALVRAATGGTIVMLRQIAAVRVGDALAAVIESEIRS